MKNSIAVAAAAFLIAIGAVFVGFMGLAHAQVLPLEDVMQTRIFSARFRGPIHHLDDSMKPSKDGRAGYEPKHIDAYASANPADTNMKYYIDIQHESGFDTITYEGDEADLFFALLMGGELKDEIEFIVLIDPADKDYVGGITYVAGYLKDGTYFGQLEVSREAAAKAIAAMAPPTTAEKPAA